MNDITRLIATYNAIHTATTSTDREHAHLALFDICHSIAYDDAHGTHYHPCNQNPCGLHQAETEQPNPAGPDCFNISGYCIHHRQPIDRCREYADTP